jgi:hypothetical protein
VDGLPRSHASIHGNALGACSRLGLAADERTRRLAEAVLSWQWPDGGWNCDNRADPRASDALDLLEERRRPDGRWNARAQWWRPPDSTTTPEVVDWGRAGEPNLMVTLNALRVLVAAGREATR